MAGYISPDARKSDQYTVYLSQAGISLPDRDYYLSDRASLCRDSQRLAGLHARHAGRVQASEAYRNR